MQILFIGDPHLRPNHFEQVKQFLNWIEEVVAIYKPDMIVNLGDTFNNHNITHTEIISEFKNHINKVCKLNIPYYYILGNHDQWKPKDSKYHTLQIFKNLYSNLHIIDETTIDYINNITFVPFIADHTRFPEINTRLCIAHQTFIGSDYGYRREDVAVDSAKVNAELIISGHIHRRQTFGKVIYPGTPYAASIDDIDQDKGLLLFNNETFEQTFIPTIFQTWRSIIYNIEDNNFLNDLIAILNEKINTKDIWIINLTGSKKDIALFQNSKELKQLQKQFNIRVRPNYTDTTKIQKTIEAVSPRDILDEYVQKIYSGTNKSQINQMIDYIISKSK